MTTASVSGFLLDRKGSGKSIDISLTDPLPDYPAGLLWAHID